MGFHHHYVHGPKLMPRLLGGASAATVLLGAEADGLSIDFTDASLVVRDTTTTSNAYNGNVQTFWRDRSFTSYASPSPKITRDSDGYYKYRPHNLASMSEAMHLTARWPTSLMTVTGNATTAPDGTSTATQFAETAVAGTPGSLSSISVTANVFYTASVYLKMNQIRYVCVAVAATASGAGGSATFDLQAGTVTQSGVSSGGGTFGSAAIENIGSGWYRCSVSASQTTATVYHVMSPATTGTPTVDAYGRENYTGNASNSFYAWGAQLNAGPTALTYTKTQAHNLCLQSADLATTWVNNNTTETTNSTAAPDGTTTADTLTESGAVATHSIYGPTNLTLAAGLTYTASVYLKQGTQRYASLRGEDTTAAAGEVYPWVTADLQAGTLTANGAVTSSAITGVGNGWYRVSVTWVQGPTLSASGNIVIALSNVATAVATTDNLGNSYDGTGALNIYVWGAQVELASSVGRYVATTTAAVYESRYELPREWDSAGACQGLLVEEARTNICLYARDLTQTSVWAATRFTTALTATGVGGTANTATTLTASNSYGNVTQRMTSASAARSLSAFIKRRTGTGVVKIAHGAPTGAELLTNGDFATNDLTGWTNASIGTGTASAASGAAALAGTDASNRARIYQGVTVTPGNWYVVTFSVTAFTSGTATCFVADDAGAAIVISGTATLSGTVTAATVAFFARSATAYLQIRTGTGGGSMSFDNVSVKAATESDITSSINSSTWTRVSITNETITNPVFGISCATSGDAIDVDYCQSEAGAFITSPIYTGSASVTRAADDIKLSPKALPYITTAGTLFSKYVGTSNANAVLAQLGDGATNDYFLIYQSATPLFQTRMNAAAANVAAIDAGALTPAVDVKFAGAFAANDVASVANGSVLGTDSDTGGAVPGAATELRIGSYAAGSLQPNTRIKQIMYLPRRMSNADMQTVTT
jgi:hypothetical protein